MEIEIRAFVDSLDEIESRLEKLGAVFVDEVEIVDHWFCPKEIYEFEKVSMHEPGDYGLRIREKRSGDEEAYELNCKVIKTRGDHNVFEEFETDVEDAKAAREILKSIGMKEFCIIIKKRTSYHYKGYTINPEDVRNFEPVIEIEKVSDSKEDIHKDSILAILNEFDIPERNIITKSITYLYMKKNSVF